MLESVNTTQKSQVGETETQADDYIQWKCVLHLKDFYFVCVCVFLHLFQIIKQT